MDAINVKRHMDPRVPAVAAEVDDVAPIAFVHAPGIYDRVRAFRGTGPRAEYPPERALEATLDHRAEAHLDDGEPDPRRGAGTEIGHALDYAQRVNRLTPAQVHHERPPARARQGFTGADVQPHDRTPVTRRAYTIAPFDQWAAQHPGPVDKRPMPAPLARKNRDYPALSGGRPSPAGRTSSTATATATPAVRIPRPRVIPRPWTEQAEASQRPTVAPARGRVFR